MKFILLSLFLLSLPVLALKPAPAQSVELIFNAEQKVAASKITLSFTGDLLVHEDLYKEVIAQNKKDFSILWKKITPLLEKADFSQVNLEGPVALGINSQRKDKGDIGFVYDGDVYSGTNFLFNYHPQIIEAIKNTGFDFVTLANNHTYDRGTIGIEKTIEAFNSKSFPFVGLRKKDSTEPLYKITPIKDFTVAWIACTEMLNGFSNKTSQTLLCYDQAQEIVSMIKKIKNEALADLVIVIPHWGVEYNHTPTTDQKKYAKLFAEVGADAIIGSHPHVLQPVEKIITSDQREVFVAYSLGNFVAYQRDIDRKASAIVYLEFSKSKESSSAPNPLSSKVSSKTWISKYTYQPTIRISREIFPAAQRPEVISHVEKYLGPFKP